MDEQRGDPGPVAQTWRSSTLAPFRHRIFLAIWAASLVSNFGSLIQGVGASWLMTSLAPSADMVALVQASTSLPIMLFSLGAGAAADLWDRRLVMLAAQVIMLVVAVVLAILTYLGTMTPWLLLALTFLLGCGAALHGPAWQSSVGEQVPRSDLPAAVALNSLGFNLARTVGPAIGGFIVASAGAQAAFVVNALSYVGLIAVLATWRPRREPGDLPPERVGAAMQAGLRYARLSPGIRVVLVRAFVFGLLGSAVWALMPVVAKDLIGGGPLIYGLLLGAFGGGAVAGALVSAWLRERTSVQVIVEGSNVAFGLASIAVALSPGLALTLLALVVAGAGWVLALSTFNVTVQLASPRWVVGRTMAIYQMVTFGGLALGSWLWGEVAHGYGLPISLGVAGAALAASALLAFWLPLVREHPVSLDPALSWPEPKADLAVAPESGPVVVTIEYRIAAADRAAFGRVMQEVGRIRRRDGGRRWTLMQDVADPELWTERFHSPTWLDHLRQQHRTTLGDRRMEERALGLHRGPEPPRVRHLLEREPGEIAYPEDAARDGQHAGDPAYPHAAAPQRRTGLQTVRAG